MGWPGIDGSKRVLLAGASGGIGRAVLTQLAGSGAWIGAHYRERNAGLREFIDEYGTDESRIRLFQADLTSERAAVELVDAFVSWAGAIDILIQLTGGVSRPVSWERITESEWQADLNLNLTAPFFLAQHAMRHMRTAGGRIILTSTASARHGGGGNSIAYGVAKAGIECVTRALAREGARSGILVNAVCPGFIQTEFHSRWMHRTAEDLNSRSKLVPLQRAGTACEVASLICFLASPQAGYITGECISVSGGDWL